MDNWVPGPLVEVEWRDTASGCAHWSPPQKAADEGTATCHSSGYLIRNDDLVVIVQSYSNTRGRQVSDSISIPTGNVLRIRTLRHHGTRRRHR